METETKIVKECTQCGWKGSDDERATKQDDVWTTYVCPKCSCESFYNIKEKATKLAISQNVHPNTDGSPWGWIVIDGTRLRVSTWSGYDEKKRCEKIVRACNSHYELLEALKKMTEQAEKLWSFADMPAEDKSGWAFKQAKEAIKNATS